MSPAAPIRLAVAAERFGLTVSALRAEARRGRLEIFRVAGKDWTTDAAVREMFEKCRVGQREPASTFAPGASAQESDTPQPGSSSTGQARLALDSALARGLPTRMIADFLGTGEEMIRRHYGHLAEDYQKEDAEAIGRK